jgi:hypothetical protein
LPEGAVESLPGALVLNQQHAFPEAVDAALAELFAAPGKIDLLREHGEEFAPETLRFGAFRGFLSPAMAELMGAAANFVPGQGRGSASQCAGQSRR